MSAPHVLGIDDGPFDPGRSADTLVVGVVMAGADLVEGVLSMRLPIDGGEATPALAAWITRSRFHPLLRAVLLDGITIAGLSVIDLPALGAAVGLPVIAATRRRPSSDRLADALRAAGYPERIESIERAGPAHECGDIFFECAGIDEADARTILESQRGKSHIPECLRLAHIIATGLATGESRGA